MKGEPTLRPPAMLERVPATLLDPLSALSPVRFEGSTAILRCTEDLSAGSELCISYGPQEGGAVRAERQTDLLRQYR